MAEQEITPKATVYPTGNIQQSNPTLQTLSGPTQNPDGTVQQVVVNPIENRQPIQPMQPIPIPIIRNIETINNPPNNNFVQIKPIVPIKNPNINRNPQSEPKEGEKRPKIVPIIPIEELRRLGKPIPMPNPTPINNQTIQQNNQQNNQGNTQVRIVHLEPPNNQPNNQQNNRPDHTESNVEQRYVLDQGVRPLGEVQPKNYFTPVLKDKSLLNRADGEQLKEARPENSYVSAPKNPTVFPKEAIDQYIDRNATPLNFENMQPFTFKSIERSKHHFITSQRKPLNNIETGQYLTTSQKYKQVFEIYNYPNLPNSYLGIVDNIIRCLNTDSKFFSLMIDEEYGFQQIFDYQTNVIVNKRAETTNDMNFNDYLNQLSNLTENDLDNFFKTNVIGVQLNNAMVFNKALYDNLKLKSEELSQQEFEAVLTLLDNNIRTGFNFVNNIDCLFNNTYGILTALYHKTDLNGNKRPKNTNVINDFKTKVLVPFLKLQDHVNSKLDRYYKELILVRNGLGFMDMNDDRLLALEEFLRLNTTEYTNVMFEDELNSFIERELNIDSTVKRQYRNGEKTIKDYYIDRIKQQIGDDFIADYNAAKQSMTEESKDDFIKKYDTLITKFISKFFHDNEDYRNNAINFKNKTYEYMKDLASNENKIIKNFIESALDYLEDNIASLGFDNFIFNHMAYRTTCLLLMYYFMPSNAYRADLEVNGAIWMGKWYSPNELKSNLAVSFDDTTAYEPSEDNDRIVTKNAMVYNEVFAMIAMKILPKLNCVNNVGYESFDANLSQNIRSVLYIIRPTKHDHTFCIAKHDNKLFFSDDVDIRGRSLRSINDPTGLNLDEGFNFVYQDMYDNLESENTYYNFIGYKNGKNTYFVNYINSSAYKNIVCIEGSNQQKIGDLFNVNMDSSDFENTMTKQLYAKPQQGGEISLSGMIEGIFKLFIIAIIIVIIVHVIHTILKKINKKGNDTDTNR